VVTEFIELMKEQLRKKDKQLQEKDIQLKSKDELLNWHKNSRKIKTIHNFLRCQKSYGLNKKLLPAAPAETVIDMDYQRFTNRAIQWIPCW